jgi:hypothetical protein
LAIVAGVCLNGFTTIDATQATSWPVSTVTVHFDVGRVMLVSTDDLWSPYREALPKACDASGAGCIHYAKTCQTGPHAADPWVRCKVEYVRAEDAYYRTLEINALNASVMDGIARRVGFVMEAGDRRSVILLTSLAETMDRVPTCRDHPDYPQGRQCRGEPRKPPEVPRPSP